MSVVKVKDTETEIWAQTNVGGKSPPNGGSAGQHLLKTGAGDNDIVWGNSCRIVGPLWQNPEPKSEFAPQTIEVDLSGYDFFMLATNFSATDPTFPGLCIFAVDEVEKMATIASTQNNRTGGRNFQYSVADKTITFQNGSYNGTTSRPAYVVPIAIWGIKGVKSLS